MVKKVLIIVYSYHHKNTEKIAKAMAKILDAEIRKPYEIIPDDIKEYDLVGFGSGIYSSNLHKSILDFIDKIQKVKDKTAIVFSTCGAPGFAVDGGHVQDYLEKVHKEVKQKLRLKGYKVVDEFICPGWNTNSFLKLFGGINKGRPNDTDLKNAEEFAKNLIN